MVTFQTHFHLGVKVWLKNNNLGPKRPDKIFIREYKIPSYLTYFDLCCGEGDCGEGDCHVGMVIVWRVIVGRLIVERVIVGRLILGRLIVM